MLGSGELGAGLAKAFTAHGAEVVACDRYANAPAMKYAARSYVLDMLDEARLSRLLDMEQPDIIIPEVEAIATDILFKAEARGMRVVPRASAVVTAMDRRLLRTLAAETLGINTSRYTFASSLEELRDGVAKIGLPCIIKPVMSSSGRGQSVLSSMDEIPQAWANAIENGRRGDANVIIEELLQFDSEITLLTVSHRGNVIFCPPVGHRQVNGDFHTAWQPATVKEAILERMQQVATEVVGALGGDGLFGVEFFLKGEDIYFSEVSCRPHDTGMLTTVTQNMSEFELHVRCSMDIDIPPLTILTPGASRALTGEGQSTNIRYRGIERAASLPGITVDIFNKPNINGHRRLGIVYGTANTVSEAITAAESAHSLITIEY